MEKRFRIIS